MPYDCNQEGISRAMVCSINTHTVAAAAVASLGAFPPGLLIVIGLIAFLVAKELCTATEEPGFAILGRHLDVAVIPLLIVVASVLTMAVALAP